MENEWVACLFVALFFGVCVALTIIVNRQKKKIREIIKQKEEWETKQLQ